MDYCILKPSPIFSQYIKHYWTIENCLTAGNEHIQRIVPNGLNELSFYFDNLPKSLDSSISINDTSNITGQLFKYFDIKIKNRLSLFSIIFQPAGLFMLFDIPVNKFVNQSIPLKYLIRNTATELETKLYDADSFIERIKIVEKFFKQRLNKIDTKYHFARIHRCLELINSTKGQLKTELLASEACLSRKQFERVFSEYIGTSPKRFIKIVRFQNTINEKNNDKDLDLTALSYKCGYFDQSHMTNDFIELSGMSPKQYFKDCEPYSDYFQ